MAEAQAMNFRTFIESRQGLHPDGETGPHDYAYHSDKHTRLAFEKIKPVEHAMTATVRLLKDVTKNELLGSAVKVGRRQFPRVYGIAKSCAETLGIATPTVYIVNSPVMNAMTFGTNDDSFIMVHSALIDRCSDDELRFVVGHECGHIHNSHVVYMTAMRYVTQMVNAFTKYSAMPTQVALLSWQRRAEITCDRAGLLCSPDPLMAARMLTRFALGSSKLMKELDLEAFLEQSKESKTGVGRFAELRASHPWIPNRVLALRVFAKSALFRRRAGLGEGGLSMTDVDAEVRKLVKVE